MSDLIDRQAAIDALDALCDRECEYSKKQRSVMCGACHLGSAFDVVEQLPSAQPERKKGFWFTLKKGDKGYSAGDFKCSVCGEPNHTWLPRPKFCPNCGADMSAFEEPIKISLGIN